MANRPYTRDEREELKMARQLVKDASAGYKEKLEATRIIRRISATVAERQQKKLQEKEEPSKPRSRRAPEEEERIGEFIRCLEEQYGN